VAGKRGGFHEKISEATVETYLHRDIRSWLITTRLTRARVEAEEQGSHTAISGNDFMAWLCILCILCNRVCTIADTYRTFRQVNRARCWKSLSGTRGLRGRRLSS